MSLDPQVLRSEAFSEIGEIIERDAGLLVERWCQRAVKEQPHAARCHHQQLRDGLVLLLKELGRALAESGSDDACQHHLKALEHGEQRWQVGWSLSEVVRDYQILRIIVLEYLEESLERPLSAREIMAFGLALDEAITASVAMYVRFRDEHVRQLEREHARSSRAASDAIHRWEQVFENAGWGMALFDANDLRLTAVNQTFAGMHNAPVDELIGRSVETLVAPESRQLFARALEKARQVGHGNCDLLHVTPAGDLLPVGASITAFRDEKGRLSYFAGSFRDITHRRGLEESLREKAERLEQADRRKDEFLALLAHELRNPLAPLTSALELVRLSGDRELVEQAAAAAERQVLQIQRLVDDLLDLSRISQGKIELRRAVVDIARPIQAAVESTRPLLDSLGHEFSVVLPERPLYVLADAARIQQVLVNLLNNAAKYTPPGGRISLAASAENREVCLRVRDTGVGIAPELLPRVFDLFTQADQNKSKAQGGLGVGLTLVRRLVELHGGRIEVGSAGLGKGSEFVVCLPAQSDKQLESMPVVQEKTPIRKCRLLVVDDNKDAVSMLALLLKRIGHDVVIAHDGDAAIEAARREKPQVVLLDIGLPGMDGYEVARQMRSDPVLSGTILVAMTGYGQEDDLQRAREAGFQHHLLKPVRLEAIEEALHRLLEPGN